MPKSKTVVKKKIGNMVLSALTGSSATPKVSNKRRELSAKRRDQERQQLEMRI
jgi:hypothetical protein